MLTLGGAACGYPLLLWLDPLAMFSASLNVLRARTDPLVWWSAIGMAAVLLTSVLWPGAWCARICPLGAMQDLLSWLPEWQASYLEALRNDDLDAADELRSEATTRIEQLRLDLTEPLEAAAAWATMSIAQLEADIAAALVLAG